MGFAIVIRAEHTRAELVPFEDGSYEAINKTIGADYTDIIGVGSMRGVKWLMAADSVREFKPWCVVNEWATLLRMFSNGDSHDVKGAERPAPQLAPRLRGSTRTDNTAQAPHRQVSGTTCV